MSTKVVSKLTLGDVVLTDVPINDIMTEMFDERTFAIDPTTHKVVLNISGAFNTSDFDLNDGIISLHKDLNITSLSIVQINNDGTTNSGSSRENGNNINKFQLSWKLTKQPYAIGITIKNSINNSNISYAIQPKNYVAMNQTIEIWLGTSQMIENGDIKIILDVYDTSNLSQSADSRTINIQFMNRVFYGASTINDMVVGSDGYVQNVPMSSLSKTLSRNIVTSFSATANNNKHFFYVVPKNIYTYDANHPLKFTVNGFSGGFDYIGTYKYANSYGYLTQYEIFMSTNANLGTQTINVSKT